MRESPRCGLPALIPSLCSCNRKYPATQNNFFPRQCGVGVVVKLYGKVSKGCGDVRCGEKKIFISYKMTELQTIQAYLAEQGFTGTIKGFNYHTIHVNRGQEIKDRKNDLQGEYVVVYSTPFWDDFEEKRMTDTAQKKSIEQYLLLEDVIPKGLLVLKYGGVFSRKILDEDDKKRIDTWIENPDNVWIPDETIQASIPIIQEVGNCSIVSMMLLLLNNDIFRLSEEEFRESSAIPDSCPLGSAEASSILGWTPETNVKNTYLQSWSKMFTALGYTNKYGDSDDFDVSTCTENVVIRLGGQYNPPISLGKYRLIGIIASHKSLTANDGHVIPIVSFRKKWWVIDSNISNPDRVGKMYPLPKFLTDDRTRVSGTNYTLNFMAYNAQSVVKINPDSNPSINMRFGYDIFPGLAKRNFYVYARVDEKVVQRPLARRADVILDPGYPGVNIDPKSSEFYGGAQSRSSPSPGGAMALITGLAWLVFASLLGSGASRDFLP